MSLDTDSAKSWEFFAALLKPSFYSLRRPRLRCLSIVSYHPYARD
jgi:hypothetical protein